MLASVKPFLKSLLLPLLLFMCSHGLHAQSMDNVVQALRSGNAAALASYFPAKVEITISNGDASYSRSQAEMVLRNFFAGHAPQAFNIVHQGTSPEGSRYFIGNLVTTGGTFRTYVYAKQLNGTTSIQEIRFEDK